MDGVLCLFHHCAVGIFVKQGLCFAQQPARRFLLRGAGLQQLCQLVQPQDGFVVVRFQCVRLQRHIYDQHDLLPQVVEGNDLVEQHQVHVLEVLGVLRFGAGFGFAVAEVIVGEISHKTPGEGRQIGEARALVLRQNFPQRLRGVLRCKGELSGLHPAILTGDLHLRVKAQEGIAAPLFAGLGAFQQVAVSGDVLQNFQRFNGRADVCQNLAADRQHIIPACQCNGFYFVQCGPYLHGFSLPVKQKLPRLVLPKEEKKNAPGRRNLLLSGTNKVKTISAVPP